jgi:hypothetical protein
LVPGTRTPCQQTVPALVVWWRRRGNSTSATFNLFQCLQLDRLLQVAPMAMLKGFLCGRSLLLRLVACHAVRVYLSFLPEASTRPSTVVPPPLFFTSSLGFRVVLIGLVDTDSNIPPEPILLGSAGMHSARTKQLPAGDGRGLQSGERGVPV